MEGKDVSLSGLIVDGKCCPLWRMSLKRSNIGDQKRSFSMDRMANHMKKKKKRCFHIYSDYSVNRISVFAWILFLTVMWLCS